MHEDLRARGACDLVDAADVIGMAVRAHDPRDLRDVAADAREVAAQRDDRTAMASVDQRQLVLDDQERVRTG